MVAFNRFIIIIAKGNGNFRCIHRCVYGFIVGLLQVKTIQLKKSSAIKNNGMSTVALVLDFGETVDADCEAGHEYCATVSVQLLAGEIYNLTRIL